MATHRQPARVGQRTLEEGDAPVPRPGAVDAPAADAPRPAPDDDPPGGAAAALRERQRRWSVEQARFEAAQRAAAEASDPPPG
jgi:hypothetical protein